MTDPTGAFYSTEDADSEGEEGKFYVWTPEQLQEILGDQAAKTFAYVYDVSDVGNFEGKSILNLPKTLSQCAQILECDEQELHAELTSSRKKLLAARSQRVRPGRDDKVLVNWNGLMIDAMARASGPLGDPRYLQAASKAARFLLTHLCKNDGRLLHTWRGGQAKLDAYLDDYACLINALLSVYESGFEESFVDEVVRLADIVLDFFHDPESGGFFYTASDHEKLIARNKDMIDSSVPSGNAMAATALLRLGKLCGVSRYIEAAVGTMQAALDVMNRAPTAAGQMLLAVDMYIGPTPEIVFLADPDDADVIQLFDDLRRRYLPNKVIAMRAPTVASQGRSSTLDAVFAGKEISGQNATAFICENFACQAPIVGKENILAAWNQLALH